MKRKASLLLQGRKILVGNDSRFRRSNYIFPGCFENYRPKTFVIHLSKRLRNFSRVKPTV